MLHFSKSKILLILATLVLGLLFSLPNFVGEDGRSSLPAFVPDSSLNLGLDLQGGSHLLLEVDTDTVQRERFDNLVSDIRLALRDQKIGYSNLAVSKEDDKFGVKVRIRNAVNLTKAKKTLQDISEPVMVNMFSGQTATELDVLQLEDGAFFVTFTEDALLQRNIKAVEQSIEIVRRRIDELGTTEPTIQRQGSNRILVQVPGLDDPERLKNLLGQTAKLNFHLLDQNVSAFDVANGARVPAGSRLLPGESGPEQQYVVRKRVMVSGDRLIDASIGFDPDSGAPEVNFRFDSVGGKKFGNVTKNNVGNPFAIVLDNQVISAPVIQTPILGGSGRITGNFSVETANDLAILLRAGALPAPLNILEERTVGPGLGADSVKAGSLASLIGFILVICFILISYRLFGFFANIALILNMTLIIGVLSALQATLTLPGIAGIVLTIGMAVDANVLIFERIREELGRGRNTINAIDAGYSRALGTIMDANITTLIAAFILFYFGSGPVRGFAVTLGVGIVTSVFTAFTVTRLMVAQWVKRNPRSADVPL
ncbi:MAG: protein translocase subunit SecD [Parvibaculales bacterium]